jgi:hypothetical protein
MEKPIGERFACTSDPKTAENDDDEKDGANQTSRLISGVGKASRLTLDLGLRRTT